MTARGPILAGFDGSDQSRDGLNLAALLAAGLGSRVLAVSVITLAPTEATWLEYERVVREDVERLQAAAREGLAGAVERETVAIRGVSPARELHDLAEARQASMIVLGSTHRGPIGRVLPGTVADRLLAAAPCPIAVAPRGYARARRAIGSIAVAYDGSAEAAVALELAAELAPAFGARLALIAVANPHHALTAVPMAGGYPGLAVTEEGTERERRRLQAALDKALETIPDGVDVGGEVVVDFEPKSVILRAAAGADLLLIGSRAYGPLGRVLLGGISSAVLREATCPVIVTPRSLVADQAEADH